MLGLALGIVLTFVLGLFVRVRFKPEVSASVRTQVVGISIGVGIIAAVICFMTLNMRGWELLGTAVLWALLLPAAMLGNWVRERVRPRSRL